MTSKKRKPQLDFRFLVLSLKQSPVIYLILAQKKPPRCISAGGGSVLIAQRAGPMIILLTRCLSPCDDRVASLCESVAMQSAVHLLICEDGSDLILILGLLSYFSNTVPETVKPYIIRISFIF